MCDIPIEIGDEEKIVRGIRLPQHYDEKKKKLRPAAFRPKAGATAISTVRQIMGDSFCKAKAVEACGNGYIGLAVIRADTARGLGSNVLDWRADFCGHSHIDYGVPAPPHNEPLESAANAAMYQRWKAMADSSTFHNDPDPAEAGWSGPPL